jgi:hypothetical protein
MFRENLGVKCVAAAVVVVGGHLVNVDVGRLMAEDKRALVGYMQNMARCWLLQHHI